MNPRHHALRGAFALLALTAATAGCAQTPGSPGGAGAAACAPTGAVALPDGINPMRMNMLDEGEPFKVYTAVEAYDDRADAQQRSPLPRAVAEQIDVSPSTLDRLFVDTLQRTQRFVVYDMRASVTADHSSVRVTAKVMDMGQVLRSMEGGRSVIESWVKLSVQVKHIETGENLLDADAAVEGRTGMTSGERFILTSADKPDAPDVLNRRVVDTKNALFRAFARAGERLEGLLRPMARVVSAGNCQVELFGGRRMGLKPNDEVVVFRTERRKLGKNTVLANTRAVALLRCGSVGSENAVCTPLRSVAGLQPQDGDSAVVTNESIARLHQP